MKELVCKMCGSHDVVNDGDLFVCQACGTKYTMETAKKMMVEGTVDVSGSTVKVDNTEKLAKLYAAARQANEDGDGQNAANYYRMILAEDPQSWEAAFYNVYYSVWDTNLLNMDNALSKLSYAVEPAMKGIVNSAMSADEKKAAVYMISADISSVIKSFHSHAHKHYLSYGAGSTDTSELIEFSRRSKNCEQLGFLLGDALVNYFGNDKDVVALAVSVWISVSGYVPDLGPQVCERLYKYDKAKAAEVARSLMTVTKKATIGVAFIVLIAISLGIAITGGVLYSNEFGAVAVALIVIGIVGVLLFYLLYKKEQDRVGNKTSMYDKYLK